ncbi:malate:quinone oxidoreductase [Lysinibacter sp. HNR]|uniref:malate:quinone oxidoreductase n=1 Tax=Lysinibacter sp. HNR TaxID=3031408 RepID=UPI00243551D0|nr:malate:quinone oxidoreductase [Lysinibacter sp. HNR]WGD36790.1 malate:quinone oxidoreductase [Lysinibacter sp. HNR]
MSNTKTVDVVLIGAGIMSATLGTLLQRLQPEWTIRVYEKLADVARESSNAWNNAGTGHAALCELNYMPEGADGSVDPAKAVSINEQFQVSRQLWASLVEEGIVSEPDTFINPVPHMTFVQGEANVSYLKTRFEALKNLPLFAGIEYSEDPWVIAEWAPLLIDQRKKGTPIAATRIPAGTDVDFGALTHQMFESMTRTGASVETEHTVRKLRRRSDGTWDVHLLSEVGRTKSIVNAKFVFVGAGGGALPLLQSSGIPEIRGFGGFPISGQFMRCDNPEIVAQHQAKVYGKAAVGAPPMSVPHLDTRVVDGNTSLLFGPYAGFSPKFLKKGSWFDLPRSVRIHNLWPMLAVARDNFSLVRYLISEVLAGRRKKMRALREFMPTARDRDWYLITAGQRVQVMKKDPKHGGVLQMGTEVVTSADGSIAGLLGASPGASTAAPIMLEVLERCFPQQFEGWRPQLTRMIPSFGTKLSDSPDKTAESLARTAAVLGINE